MSALPPKAEIRRRAPDPGEYRQAAGGRTYHACDHDAQVKTVMREPTRKCQKEWSFEPPMCTVDRDQLHLSVQSGLCAWRSAPEQQIAIQRQGEWCLSLCHKLRPLLMSRRDQRPCSDEQMVESVPSAWIPSPGPRHRF